MNTPSPPSAPAPGSFAWGYIESPLLSRVYVAATEAGVCAAAYDVRAEEGFLREAGEILGGAVGVHDPAMPVVAQALDELAAYLAGTRRAFTVLVDLRHVRGAFLRKALEELQKVPYGHLVSYGELARRAGQPRAARAAGAACKANTIAILVPCHRVIHAAGDLGGWDGPLWHKRALLELEGVTFGPEDAVWRGAGRWRPGVRRSG